MFARFARWASGLAFVAMACVNASPAHGGIIPPPWHGGTNPDFSSPQTDQLWTFSNPLVPPTLPDQFNNPNGAPSLNPDGSTFSPSNPFGGNANPGGWVVGDGQFLDFLIPNYNQQLVKQIWVVIKFSTPSAGVGVPFGTILGTDGSPGVQINAPTISPVPGVPNLSEVAYLYEMPTCWTFNLTIRFPIGIPSSAGYIDQVYVATRCIPTPGAAGITLGVGLLALRRRR